MVKERHHLYFIPCTTTLKPWELTYLLIIKYSFIRKDEAREYADYAIMLQVKILVK